MTPSARSFERLSKVDRSSGGPKSRDVLSELLLPAWSRALVLKDREDTRFIFLATADKATAALDVAGDAAPPHCSSLSPPAKERSRQLLAVHRLADLGAAQTVLLLRRLSRADPENLLFLKDLPRATEDLARSTILARAPS